MDTLASCWNDLQKIRATKPLVHNVTNYVVMNTTANALLALGASPIMAHSKQELLELIGIANGLVLNIGTLDSHWIDSMKMAAELAAERNISTVVDPVGAGASELRTQTSLSLMKILRNVPLICKGNASEVLALARATGNLSPVRYSIASIAGSGTSTKGVDSQHESTAMVDLAYGLAKKFTCQVVVSGKTDVITDGKQVQYVIGGNHMMPLVTGMGCIASAVVGAFGAVNDDASVSSRNGMLVMSAAGMMAGKQASGPGSFQVHFIDALHNISQEDIARFLEHTS